ncbi:RTA1-domain-containing protein [Dendrothele bispora CBS 962.96]|uniref:RTA1-domain-containing protein n=1 Tax=Dendrothele bispora (strain CBS 962.96) TaxID=1314807 RepID=A0A4S8LXV2_DENBC|nr:RTA1-domain-containing protein [Dendrothele bispora CBS 962.96]
MTGGLPEPRPITSHINTGSKGDFMVDVGDPIPQQSEHVCVRPEGTLDASHLENEVNISDDSGDHVQPDGPYGYLPNSAICITFIVLFGLSPLLHAIQTIWTRHWFFLYTALLCGLLETLGWAARFWSIQNLFNGQAFTIQISTLIIAPTFLLAAVFMVFGDLIKMLGVQYSRLGPFLYARIFFTCDIISLALQGIGGGMASAAADNNGNIQPGTNLILVGIVLQLVIIVAFMLLAGEFLYRYRND